MKVLFIIPGDINLPTGGYRYDRSILEEWDKAEIDYELVNLIGNYPFPSGVEKQAALNLIDTFPHGDIAVVDGLAGGALPDFMAKLAAKMPVVALIHHPLCLENGLNQTQKETLQTSEANGLRHVSGILTTSPATTKTVIELFDFNSAKVETVLPGVERGDISSNREDTTLNLLCIGSMIERKGHRTFLSALTELTHLEWHLDCIGMISPNDALYESLRIFIKTHKLEERVTFHGAVSEGALKEAYKKADIFVLPSLYEGYGMAYAEAIVRGIPVIGTTAGAIPDTVPDNCGILVEPQNAIALRGALNKMITDSSLRNTYSKACLKQEPNFPTWQNSADQFAKILSMWI